MTHGPRRFALAVSGMAIMAIVACSSSKHMDLSSGTVVSGPSGPTTVINGEEVPSVQGQLEHTTVMPDGQGGVALVPGPKREPLNEDYVAAREIKLKMRELADQLVNDMKECNLRGTVALPVTFVNLHNFNQTSDFGRLLAEQLFYELNQRGYPVREYRMAGSIKMKEKHGEYILSRELGAIRPGNSVVIVGTYSKAGQAVIVNARLVRPSDGRVLRTANLVFDGNNVIGSLLRRTSSANVVTLPSGGGMRIRDFENTKRPRQSQSLTPFDQGQDIH